MPTVNNSRHSGIEGSQLHIDLVHKYHKVIRSMSTKDISCLTQCFHLANLFKSHRAYVEEFRKQGIATQTVRQKVTHLLYDVFNTELGTIVSQQMINNHVKEGQHWYEVLHTRETQHFGDGLLLLLPARGYADIARKTADSVWTFLLPLICNISPRIINLAITLQAIAKALQTKGTGHVDVALLGYELRSPTNLHELTRSYFNVCLASYPDLDVKDTLRTIGLHGRADDPDMILAQAKPDSYSRNLNDDLYDSHILQQSGDDVPQIDQRDIESPEGVVQASNNGNLQDDHHNGNNLQEGGENSIQSDQSDVESIEGVAAISFPRFLILGTNAREDPIHSNNNLNDGIVEATDSGLILPLRAFIDRPDSHRFTRSKSSSSSSTNYRGTIPLMFRHSCNTQADGDNAYERIIKLESSPQPKLDSEDERILCLFNKTPTSHTIKVFSIQRDNMLEQPYNISPIRGDLISQPSLQPRHHTLQANSFSSQSLYLQHDSIQVTCSPSLVTSMQYYKEAVTIESATSPENIPQTPQLEVFQGISPSPDTGNVEDAISPEVWEDLIAAIEEDDSFPSIP
ncbi:hypothetical protein L873DRAFT_1931656 [Choiromyces venosus 120613-1]|uniref:Uncharacterized protein n=1 Tax=Choiromyces venosus 120613-1 TaxID=1336337 RepID=A0A3N4JNH2_9PEZI|nr:hypothetical protein L873DRAFT_1931656 [Choiromyces venosus 120613-1]